MTHEEAVNILYSRKWDSLPEGFYLSNVVDWYDAKCKIPLIHIPEVARIIGVKPSEIDPFFKGKDNILIDWRGER